MSTENSTGQRQGSTDCLTLGDTNLVSSPAAASSGSALSHPTEPTTSTSQEPGLSGMSYVRECFRRMQIPADVTQVLTASWRKGTQRQYATYLQKWVAFCSEREVDCLAPSLNDAVNTRNNKGLSYSGKQPARQYLLSLR